jgi:hypothetical protein
VTTPTTPARSGSVPWRWFAALTVASLLLGVYADVGGYAAGVWGVVPELGTPWVLLAFAGGRVARRRVVTAAASGSLLILLGLATYWAFVHLAYGVELYQYVGNGRGLFWGALAIALGSAAGLAGRASTAPVRWRAAAGWGFAVGVAVAEGAHMLSWAGYSDSDALAAVLLTAAAATTGVALRDARLWPLALSSLAWSALGLSAYVVVR